MLELFNGVKAKATSYFLWGKNEANRIPKGHNNPHLGKPLGAAKLYFSAILNRVGICAMRTINNPCPDTFLLKKYPKKAPQLN